MYKLILLLTLSFCVSANLMYFEVDSILLERDPGMDHLHGATVARDVVIKYQDVEFDLTENGELFSVEGSLYNSKINFKKDNLNLTTHFPYFQGIDIIDYISADKALIEFSDVGFRAKGRNLSLSADSFYLDIDQVDLICKGDKFDFNIDRTCIKNMHIKPNTGEEFTRLDITQGIDKLSEIFIEAQELKIEKDIFSTIATQINGYIGDVKLDLIKLSLECFKYEDMTSFDLVKLLSGCVKNSTVSGKELSIMKGTTPFNVFDGSIIIREETVGVKANKVVTSTSKGYFVLDKIEASCRKNPDISTNTDSIFLGCLKDAHVTVSKIHDNESELEDAESLRDMKRLSFKVEDRSFVLKTKLKYIFNIQIKIEGGIEIIEAKRNIRVNVKKAKVAGIPATTMAIKILKKFISSDAISLEGRTIVIKY